MHRVATADDITVTNLPSGYFPVYLLALTWWPEYCTTINEYNCSQLSGKYTQTHIGLHGLWPQYYRIPATYPTYCLDSPGGDAFDKNKLTQETWQHYQSLVPFDAEQLAQHEWAKHGTCSGLTQQQFFQKSIQAAMLTLGTPIGFQSYIGKSLSYTQLANFFGGVDRVELICDYDSTDDKYYFSQVITIWDKNTSKPLSNPGFESSCPKNKPIYIRSVGNPSKK